MELINRIITSGSRSIMTEVQFLEAEIRTWEVSKRRQLQLKAESYYAGDHDILSRKRQEIGADGQLTDVNNLPNNKLVDNQYANAVDMKTNYLFAKPFTVESDDEKYTKALEKVFNNRFRRQLKRVGRGAINGGVAWLHPYYDDNGILKFKMFESWEVLPFWKDSEHTELDAALRLYTIEAYEGTKLVEIKKVEYYTADGIKRYILTKEGKLIVDVENPSSTHITAIDPSGNELPLNWDRVPLIAFKSSDTETPLIKRVKSLQDAINLIDSDFVNNMEEGPRTSILVLENYDGEDLGQFRHNLALYGAVKVTSGNAEGGRGDVRVLKVEVNSDNYKAIRTVLKEALIANARSVDSKDDRMGSGTNEKNLQSMYMAMDVDANGMELEFQASFEELMFFINADLANKKVGDFDGVDVDVLFNRDVITSEGDTIINLKNSVGMISDETIIANHPMVKDKDTEMKRLKAEKEEKAALLTDDPFANNGDDDPEGNLNE